ncbi:MAG: benzoate-CoA ligase family protein [Rhizobiaceae bacterium]
MESNENAAIHFVDRHLAEGRGEASAFIEAAGKGRTMTYRQLAEESGRMVSLYEHFGIRREERVAMLVLDQLEFPVIFWGSLKAGVIPVAINTLLGSDVYDAILRDSRARVLFVSAELLAAVEPVLEGNPWLEEVFVITDEDSGRHHAFGKELARGEPKPAVMASSEECAFWLYSSGSTGRPKGVRHVHGSLKVTADTYGAQVLGISRNDIIFSAAKLFFAYGLGNGMTFPMAVGATAILLSGRPTPDGVLAILDKNRPTIFCGVPTLYAALCAHMEANKLQMSTKLSRCISAGEALPEEVGQKWEKLSGCEILDGVGSTEMLHIFLSNQRGDVRYGTSGVAVPGYELRLVDEKGEEVAPGGIGELLVKGGSSASDYWNQREKSRTTFEGEWTRTGDKYEKQKDGRLVYCGRTDDMFKVSGIWLSPFEVEQALIGHSSVLEAAVVAVRDSDGLEKPKAFVVLKSGAERSGLAGELKEHVKARIGKWKYPRWIEFIDELPKTATGKIQRFKLRG